MRHAFCPRHRAGLLSEGCLLAVSSGNCRSTVLNNGVQGATTVDGLRDRPIGTNATFPHVLTVQAAAKARSLARMRNLRIELPRKTLAYPSALLRSSVFALRPTKRCCRSGRTLLTSRQLRSCFAREVKVSCGVVLASNRRAAEYPSPRCVHRSLRAPHPRFEMVRVDCPRQGTGRGGQETPAVQCQYRGDPSP